MDLNYLFHRQQIERARAATADCDEARVAHEQLARCYEAQIEQATEGAKLFPDASLEQPAQAGASVSETSSANSSR